LWLVSRPCRSAGTFKMRCDRMAETLRSKDQSVRGQVCYQIAANDASSLMLSRPAKAMPQVLAIRQFGLSGSSCRDSKVAVVPSRADNEWLTTSDRAADTGHSTSQAGCPDSDAIGFTQASPRTIPEHCRCGRSSIDPARRPSHWRPQRRSLRPSPWPQRAPRSIKRPFAAAAAAGVKENVESAMGRWPATGGTRRTVHR